ncbi:hypothetical protein STENM223S_04944 [Streptomyces tendae]
MARTGSAAANSDRTAFVSASCSLTDDEVKLRSRPRAQPDDAPQMRAVMRGEGARDCPRSTPMHTSEPSQARSGSQTRDCHRSGGSPMSR